MARSERSRDLLKKESAVLLLKVHILPVGKERGLQEQDLLVDGHNIIFPGRI